MLSERNRRLANEHLDAIAVYDEEQMNALLDAARSEADERAKGLVEAAAQAVYEQWREQPGYVPWVPRGNSRKQDEARDIIRSALKSMEDSHPVSGSEPSPVGEGE